MTSSFSRRCSQGRQKVEGLKWKENLFLSLLFVLMQRWLTPHPPARQSPEVSTAQCKMTELPFRGVQTVEICVVSKLGINKAHLFYLIKTAVSLFHRRCFTSSTETRCLVTAAAAGKQRAATGKGFQTMLQLKNLPTGGAALTARRGRPFPKLMQILFPRCCSATPGPGRLGRLVSG